MSVIINPSTGGGSAKPPFYFADANETSIRAAAAAANAAGGGYVIIPAGTITLTQSLPAYNYVVYEGAPMGTQISSGVISNRGATILSAANNTIIGYSYNSTDGVTPPTNFNTFLAGMLIGAGLKNLVFEGFSYGVKIGSLYNPGMQDCNFENVFCQNSVNWEFYVENYIFCRFVNIHGNSSGVGAIARVGSGFTALNNGNSEWHSTNAIMNNYGVRGICTWARNTSALNQDNTYNEESGPAYTSTISQAATMSNTSANIGVTDSTKFPAGMPVTFSASANGFAGAGTPANPGQTYFILTSAANIVTVGTTTYGSAVVATGNAAVNIQSRGFALFEFAGLDSGSTITNVNVWSPDGEGSATTQVLMQNTIACSVVQGLFGSGGGATYCVFALRGANRNWLVEFIQYDVDADSGSTQNKYDGLATGNSATSVWLGNGALSKSYLSQANVALGTSSLQNYVGATGGHNNLGIGSFSFNSLDDGSNNIGIGTNAAQNITAVAVGASNNTFIGSQAGKSITGGNNNTLIGGWVGPSSTLSSAIGFSDGGGTLLQDWSYINNNVWSFQRTTTAVGLRIYNTLDSVTSPVNWEYGALDWTINSNVLTIATNKNGTGTARDIWVAPASNIFAQARDGSAQSFYVYNNTNNASNWERAVIDWNITSNVLVMGTKASGSGTVRPVWLGAGTAGNVTIGIAGTSYAVRGLSLLGGLSGSVHNLLITWNCNGNTYNPTTGSDQDPNATTKTIWWIGRDTGLDNVSTPTRQFMFGMDSGIFSIGGTSSSFPGFINSGAVMQCVLADNSALATLKASLFQTATASVATGGGASTASFAASSVGGTGQPTTATQNSWIKMLDSTGATVWVPVWK